MGGGPAAGSAAGSGSGSGSGSGGDVECEEGDMQWTDNPLASVLQASGSGYVGLNTSGFDCADSVDSGSGSGSGVGTGTAGSNLTPKRTPLQARTQQPSAASSLVQLHLKSGRQITVGVSSPAAKPVKGITALGRTPAAAAAGSAKKGLVLSINLPGGGDLSIGSAGGAVERRNRRLASGLESAVRTRSLFGNSLAGLTVEPADELSSSGAYAELLAKLGYGKPVVEETEVQAEPEVETAAAEGGDEEYKSERAKHILYRCPPPG